MVIAPKSLANLSAQELLEMVTGLMARITQRDETIASKDREIKYRQAKIDQLTHEMAVLKRLASSDVVVSNSTRPRPACSMRPSMPTSQPLSSNCRR